MVSKPEQRREQTLAQKSTAPANAPKAPRAERTRMRTREKLVTAAQSVMARTGVEKATIAEIASEADVGFGSFYNHFSSKEEIATAVFDAQTEKLAEVLDNVRATVSDPALVISFVQRLILHKAHLDPVWGWFIVRAQSALPQMQKAFQERGIMTFKRGLAEKRFHFKDADVAMTITLGGLIAVIRSMLEGNLKGAVETEFVELMLRMYGVSLTEAKSLARHPIPKELLNALA